MAQRGLELTDETAEHIEFQVAGLAKDPSLRRVWSIIRLRDFFRQWLLVYASQIM